MLKNNSPICMFDSGIGGLTVLKKLSGRFPSENYIYLADLARVPFGDRTTEDIKKIVYELIEWLIKFKPKLIIMACNTSSAVFSSQLSTLSSSAKGGPAFGGQLEIPVYGVIESCANEIAKANYKKVTVWATKLAIEQHGYKDAINNYNPNISVEEISCPKLVPMIESLSFDDSIISEYTGLTSENSECLVLGCTHYPHIEKNIKLLRNIKIIDPADSLVNEMEEYLQPSNTSETKNITLYTTAQLEKVSRFSRIYLCGEYTVNQVTLNKSLLKTG